MIAKNDAKFNLSKLLELAVRIWFTLATFGQFAFGIYIIAFYGSSAIDNDFEKWNNVLPHGYVTGDWKGNLVVIIHILLASIITFGGPLQIIPFIRNRFKSFHRLLGKIYLTTAVIVSLAGLIMVIQRGTIGDNGQRFLICVQVIYILWFAFKTLQEGRLRNIDKHRKWALRLFMVTNGVWFFRIGLMAWMLVWQKPVGFDYKTFTGPFLTVLATITYAIPVALLTLELYFYAQKRKSKSLYLVTSSLIIVLTIITLLGVIGTISGLWIPRINGSSF